MAQGAHDALKLLRGPDRPVGGWSSGRSSGRGDAAAAAEEEQ